MKLKKAILNLSLVLTFVVPLSSCNEIEYENLEIKNIDDNYRSIYQIMPVSFADSNGDGVGDLKGIVDKVDYLDSLNYTGVWLTPVHPSETYHKYDVDDYKDIDPKLGTLEDYDELVSKLHEKKMTILLDLVLNHSSDSHPWFNYCINAHKSNRTTSKYYNFYNVVHLSSGESTPSGYTKVGNLAYESRFWSGMPDLNLGEVLEHPDGELANEIKSILKFWLVDHNIDGFRLDAVTSYFTGNEPKNVEFLTWLNTECKKLKPSCYIVGEGSWGAGVTNQRYQSSGVDSFFNFSNHGSGGYVAQIVSGDASYFPFALEKNKEAAVNGIEAPFIANHDTGHMIGCVKGRSDINNLKFGHGILAMLNGTTFTYNGDEIGMAVPSSSKKDEDKRLPVNFGDSYTPKPVEGASKFDPKEIYPYGSVASQLKDKNSVVNYIKKANLLRKEFPSIARGEFKEEFLSQNEKFVVVSKTYNNEKIFIAINTSNSSSYDFNFSEYGTNIRPVSELCAKGNCKLNKSGNIIAIPTLGIALFR